MSNATDKQIAFATEIMGRLIAAIRSYIDDECAPGAAEAFIAKLHVSPVNAVAWIDEFKHIQTDVAMDLADKGFDGWFWTGMQKRIVHGPKLRSLIA